MGLDGLVGLLIAALGGAAVGIERQRSSQVVVNGRRFAGVRTFALLGVLSGLAGWLITRGQPLSGALLLCGAAALVAMAYGASVKHDLDGTTHVAALVVLGAGLCAGMHEWQLSSGLFAATTLLLAEKSRLHSAVARMSDEGIRAGIQFGVMALIVLPLLPEGPYGPLGGVRPRELWMLVLVFSGLSFVGYIARSLVGAGKGYVLAGFLGGLVSSTNVALTFSRLSRAEQGMAGPLALGVLAASTLMFLRILTATALLNASMTTDLALLFTLPVLAGTVMVLLGLRKKKAGSEPPMLANPLELTAAIQMALMFQCVLFGVHWVKESWGGAGLAVSGAILGMTDVDALTFSMARAGQDTAVRALAVRATAVGALSNTLLKCAVVLALASPGLRWRAAGGLLVIAALLGAALVGAELLVR